MQQDIGLGHLVIGPRERDAVHVAVIPATAAEDLKPGTPVVMVEGKGAMRAALSSSAVGVVDPFLAFGYHGSESAGPVVQKGEVFWLMLKPGTITSLTHLWTHPAFPLDTIESRREEDIVGRYESEQWLRKHFGERSYADLVQEAMAAAAGTNDYVWVGGDSEQDFANEHRDEFWFHIERVTGRRFDPRAKAQAYFSCSC